MSARGDDVIRIPIEIKTEDSDEIKKLLQEITEAESKVRELEPRRGKKQDVTSRAALDVQPFDERGGIFRGPGAEIPAASVIRNKTSRQPFQRENEFKKLRSQVGELETQQGDLTNIMSSFGQGLGFGAILNRGGKLSAGARAKGAMPMGAALARGGPGKFMGGGALGVLKGALPVALVFMAFEIFSTVVTALQQPGGPLDRRFKRIIQDEFSSTLSRGEKQKIRQGLTIIRTTPYQGFRGPSVSPAAEQAGLGQPQFSNTFDLTSKGVRMP